MSGHWHNDLYQLFHGAVSKRNIEKRVFFLFYFSTPCLLPPFCCRENILKTAKALVEDTKLLVSGAASSQDKLAQAAQSSANTITQLAEVVKLGAASLGSDDPETQVRCS